MAPTEYTQHTPLSGTPGPEVTPKSVKVDITGGSGMNIEWKDGHKSHYSFVWLRDACPCAVCDDERSKEDRDPGQPKKPDPSALPMFKPPAKPTEAAGVGKYAIRFTWNDGHQHGIYSWEFLRQWCPCRECSAMRNVAKLESGSGQLQ
ncbi:MAG: gamma-butyrobetaine hydroxylase-like domain-containing protein [Terriglobales bacterium]